MIAYSQTGARQRVKNQTVLQSNKIKLIAPRRVKNRREFFIAALVVAVAMAQFAGAETSGYLPTVGPASLRYQIIPPMVTNQVVLPPPPAPVAEVVEPPAPVAPAPKAPPVITNVGSSAPELAHPEDVVSPQMLLKYFNKSTNGSSLGIVAPLNFTPPKTAEPAPASSATYSTGP
jgi:hypothetical protein